MSHRASNWLADLPADAMNASAFRVLFHLANAHNSLRDPAEACFPQQTALLKATGLSNGGLNNALNALESSGLVRRIAATDQDGRRRTYYILGCDFGLLAEQTPKNGVSPNSTFGDTKLQSGHIPNSNSVEFDTKAEPGIEPGIEPVRREADQLSLISEQDPTPAKKSNDAAFDRFWKSYPRKDAKAAARKNFDRAVKAGADPERIIEGARRYAVWLTSAKPGEFRPIAKFAQGWLTDQRWEDEEIWKSGSDDDPSLMRYRAIRERAEAAARH
jgi:hypothetical protein